MPMTRQIQAHAEVTLLGEQPTDPVVVSALQRVLNAAGKDEERRRGRLALVAEQAEPYARRRAQEADFFLSVRMDWRKRDEQAGAGGGYSCVEFHGDTLPLRCWLWQRRGALPGCSAQTE